MFGMWCWHLFYSLSRGVGSVAWMIIKLRNRILRLFDPPHQMMSSLQLRVEAQLEEFWCCNCWGHGSSENIFSRVFEGMKQPVSHYFISGSSTSCRKVKLWICLNKFQGWKLNYLDRRWSFRVCDLAPKSLVPSEFYVAHCSICKIIKWIINWVIGCLLLLRDWFSVSSPGKLYERGLESLLGIWLKLQTTNIHEPRKLADKLFCPLSSTVIPISVFSKSREACCSCTTRQETKFQWTCDFKKDVVVGMSYCI